MILCNLDLGLKEDNASSKVKTSSVLAGKRAKPVHYKVVAILILTSTAQHHGFVLSYCPSDIMPM